MNEQKANELFERSILLLQQGLPQDALQILIKLDRTIPSNPSILFFTATCFSMSGNKHKAIQIYERVLRLNPQFIEAYNNLGLDLAYLGEHQKAITAFDQALAIRPDFIECQINKGASLNELTLTQEAIAQLETALHHSPGNPGALANLTTSYIKLGHYERAKEIAMATLANDPNDFRAYQNLGVISLKQEQGQEAVDFFKRAYELNPNDLSIISGLGAAYWELNNAQEATSFFERALQLDAEHGQTYSNLGVLHQELRQFDQSIHCFSKAVNDKKRLAGREYNRSLSRLHAGLMADGWQDYALRWKESDQPIPYLQTQRPLWDGTATTNPILIWHEQGIGDQILFCTLLNEALQIAPNLLVRLDKRLIPLFERSLSKIRFISHDEQLDDNDFTYHLPIGDLARLFRPTLQDFDSQLASYLQSNSDQVKQLRSNFEVGKPVVGLAWVTKGKRSKERNLPIDEVVSVVQNAFSSELVDLQYSDTSEDRTRIFQKLGAEIRHLDQIDNFHDLDGLASLISACDFVITCSNSTAHLAGALGKETYLLVPFGRGRHWYWSHISDHGQSLWYPSVRIIPQTIAGNWAEPIQVLKDSIASRPKLG